MTDLLLAIENTGPEAAAWTFVLLFAIGFAAWYRHEQKRLRDIDKTLGPPSKPISLFRYGKGKRK